MKKLTALLLIPLLVSLTGCAGYGPGADKPMQLSHVAKLAVPTFKNTTLVPRLEVLTTNAVIKKLQTMGAYQIVNREEADAVLVGELYNVQRYQFRAVRSNSLQTSEIMATVNLRYYVMDKAGNKVFLAEKIASSHQVLDPSFQLTERQILADAAERISTEVASELSEGW
jgi:hypothetical protein